MWEDVYYTEEEIIHLMGYEPEYKNRKLATLNDSEEIREKYREELIKRYSFLYENSYLLLGCVINFYSISGHLLFGENDPFSGMKKEIAKVLGISNHFYHLGESKEFIYLIEEAFLGDKPLEETEIYNIICGIKEREFCFDYLKDEYDINNLNHEQFHKIDIAFRVLLESMRVFINANGCENGWIHLLQEKLDVLGVYYDIHNYGLKKIGVLDEISSFDFKFNIDRKISSSDIHFNNFIHSFAKSYLNYIPENSKNTISDDVKKTLYYKYHNVLDWDLTILCESDDKLDRPFNTNSCGSSFRVREGEIFFYEDSFYHLCPNCSYIVSVDKGIIPSIIADRIKERSLEDKFIGRKMILFSEYKSLIKKREN